MRVAIFDFDGTIYKDETFQLMMDHLKDHPNVTGYDKFYRSIVPIYGLYKAKLYPESRMKAKLMWHYLRAFEGKTDQDVFQFFAEVKDKIMSNLNEEVVKRLQDHHRDGYYTIVVSGAFTPFLNATIDELPFDRRIGTEIEYVDGVLPKRFKMSHMQGKEKMRTLENIFEGKEIDWDHSYGYGDSFSDLSFLNIVGHPVAVMPDEKLEAHAKKEGWEIMLDEHVKL